MLLLLCSRPRATSAALSRHGLVPNCGLAPDTASCLCCYLCRLKFWSKTPSGAAPPPTVCWTFALMATNLCLEEQILKQAAKKVQIIRSASDERFKQHQQFSSLFLLLASLNFRLCLEFLFYLLLLSSPTNVIALKFNLKRFACPADPF